MCVCVCAGGYNLLQWLKFVAVIDSNYFITLQITFIYYYGTPEICCLYLFELMMSLHWMTEGGG